MKAQTEKTNKKQLPIQRAEQQASAGGTATIEDNRPGTVYQRQLRGMMDPRHGKGVKSMPSDIRGEVVQLKELDKAIDLNKLNIVGENHKKYENITDFRNEERANVYNYFGNKDSYWEEGEFLVEDDNDCRVGDPPFLRLGYRVLNVLYKISLRKNKNEVKREVRQVLAEIGGIKEHKEIFPRLHYDRIEILGDQLTTDLQNKKKWKNKVKQTLKKNLEIWGIEEEAIQSNSRYLSPKKLKNNLRQKRKERSKEMHEIAVANKNTKKGIWKVGDSHIGDIMDILKKEKRTRDYNLLSKEGFATWQDTEKAYRPT